MKNKKVNLRTLIQREINRLASSPKEEDVHLVNKVLRPMVLFINAHDKIMSEIVRIGSKHSL